MRSFKYLYPPAGVQFESFPIEQGRPVSIRVKRQHQYPKKCLEITLILDYNLGRGSVSAKVKALSKSKEIYESKFIRLKSKYRRKVTIRVNKDTRKPIDRLQIITHRPALLVAHIRAL